MKKKTLMFALLLPVLFFAISHRVAAQDSTAGSYEENARVDSIVKAHDQQEAAKLEQRKDSRNLADLKSQKDETKAKSKEAQRVEAQANEAARESKAAYRMEKKAQKLREQADKQSKKAERARNTSDQN